MWSIRWSTSSGPASKGAGVAGGQGHRGGLATSGAPGIDQDVTQRTQYGAVGCGVEITHDQHGTRSVELGSGGELGQQRRLSQPIIAVRDAVFEARGDHVQRTARMVDRGHERDGRPTAVPRWQRLDAAGGNRPTTDQSHSEGHTLVVRIPRGIGHRRIGRLGVRRMTAERFRYLLGLGGVLVAPYLLQS
jgi:hypothetical protein